MRKHRYVIVPAVCCMLALAPLPAYAVTYQTEVTNGVSIGDISISLNEYEYDKDGNEIPYQDHKVILPGQTVDKLVRITNNAKPAWIRAKLEYISADGLTGLSDDMCTLDSSDWIRCGDYYYYTKPVQSKESINFLKKVKMPTDWDSSTADSEFSLIVTADAVQEANFEPDFSGDDPWFGTPIETCVHTSYTEKMSANQKFAVQFENGADGLVKIGDDFFSNWENLMPGDIVSDTVTLRNNYNRTVYIYFRTETIQDDDLLKKLHLEIKNGEETIYSGTMDGGIKDNILLASLPYQGESTLTYTVSVPKELGNAFAMTNTQTKWIFSAEMKRSSGGGGGGGSHSSSGSHKPDTTGPSNDPSTTTPDQTIDSNPQPDPNNPEPISAIVSKIIPKLGDSSFVQNVFIISAIALIIVALPGKRDDKKDRRKTAGGKYDDKES